MNHEVSADEAHRYTTTRLLQIVADLTTEIGLLEAHTAALRAENEQLTKRLLAENLAATDTPWGRTEGASNDQ